MGADTKHLLSLNGAAIFILLLSAAMYTSDHRSYGNALQERDKTRRMTSDKVGQLQSTVSSLQAQVVAWLAHTGRHRYTDLSRNELYKRPWKVEDVALMRHDAAAKSNARIAGLGPGNRQVEGHETEARTPVELSDEALLHWESTLLKKRQRAVSHTAPVTGVVTIIPGRDPPPAADEVLEDFSHQHAVLAYTKEAFVSTPLSIMTDAYAPAASGHAAKKRSCDDDFGNGLVQRWRDTKEEWCQPKGSATREVDGTGKAGASSLQCYFLEQSEHGGDGDNLCVLENMSIDLAPFSDEVLTKKVMTEYKASQHNDQAYVHFAKGTVQAQCQLDNAKYTEKKFPGWNGDWLWGGLDATPDHHQRLHCDMWEDRTTLFVERDTFANMYHDTEDFVNAYLALAILEIAVKDVQIILSDLYPWGPFESIWQQGFGAVNPALTAWDMKDTYGTKRVCFKKGIIGIYGPASPFCIMATDTGCVNSPLMRSYSDFIIRGMALQRYTYPVQRKASKVVVINWMARRSSVKWPERSFCDDHYFKCTFFEHLKQRSLSRVVKNDDQVVAALRILAEEQKVEGKSLFFMDADYNVLPFEMQMRYNLMTDVMIGPHGAGLTHQMFLPDRARLIELFIDGSSGNRHFHNMARWRGRVGDMYQGVEMDNPVPIKKVEELVLGAVRKINVDAY